MWSLGPLVETASSETIQKISLDTSQPLYTTARSRLCKWTGGQEQRKERSENHEIQKREEETEEQGKQQTQKEQEGIKKIRNTVKRNYITKRTDRQKEKCCKKEGALIRTT